MKLFIHVRINNDLIDTYQLLGLIRIYKESQSRSVKVTKYLFNSTNDQMYGKLICRFVNTWISYKKRNRIKLVSNNNV